MIKIDVKDKDVLVRVDFNVPIKEGKVSDDTRIKAAIPTINTLLDQGARKIILLSHLGRPLKALNEDGSLNVAKFSLAPVAPHLAALIRKPVLFVPYVSGPEAEKAVAEAPSGSILLLENTRFEAGEEKGKQELAEKWAKLGQVFINDAFGTAHRAHASNAILAGFFDAAHKSFGLLMQKEVESAQKVLNQPERPFTAILGGAKVSDKILLIENLLDKADNIIIGGGMAYTFMKAQGGKIGSSLCEEEKLDLANELVTKAKAKGVNLLLPVDSIAADAFAADAKTQLVMSNQIPDGWLGLDIGPEAVVTFSDAIKASKTICWNGPMGVFEMPAFANGTKKIAEAVAAATKLGAFSLVGGGDSVAAVNQMGLDDEVSYVSTGGGAMLTMLEGGDMPGISSIG
ncbi:MAG TPA: phosphoglycerate kinase [Saprospiraceae bacterium]|nr:phosphoglycerate kinase [Saprospiraceae bacterium]HPG07755.1 phosphoglycerate kinase [Saprospiraceae bacterium]HRV87405.1 phosphoglycerate kinase [Saprospiraceae bacterium]